MIAYREPDNTPDNEALADENKRLKTEIDMLENRPLSPWWTIPFWRAEVPFHCAIWVNVVLCITMTCALMFHAHALQLHFRITQPYFVFWLWLAHVLLGVVVPTVYVWMGYMRCMNIRSDHIYDLSMNTSTLIERGHHGDYIVYSRNNPGKKKDARLGSSSTLLGALRISHELEPLVD